MSPAVAGRGVQRGAPDGPAASHLAGAPAELDPESRDWIERLASTGPARVAATEALFELLHRGTRHEASRRRASLPDAVAGDLDDLARQAAADALVAILRKLGEYRGASRFTTWAWKFAIFEVSAALRRAAWRGRAISIDDTAWERLPDGLTLDPHAMVEGRDLVAAIRRCVAEDLTPLQRDVFLAIVVLEVPVDVVADRRGATRGATYKALHDARNRLRRSLAAQGWASGPGGAA